MSKALSSGHYCEVAPGIRLHYAQAGAPDAPLMLFLHGFPEFWYAWRALLPAFGADFHAVAPDLRGFNLSSKPAAVQAYRAGAIVQDLRGLMRGLGHSRCTLVAHDWGGAAAWTLAIAHPELVERLVILNSPHPVSFARALAEDPAQQAASEYMNWLRQPGSEERLAADDCALLRGFFLRMGGDSWFRGEVVDAYQAAWAQPGALTGGVNYYRATPLHPPTATEAGARAVNLRAEDFIVRVPTLVIWGERDTALLPGLLDGLERCVPDLKLVRWPQASHWLIHEDPVQAIEEIRNFVRAPRPSADPEVQHGTR